ncbi:MAG: VCBS repeat-containing protein [Saonia sp.]
MNTLKRISYYLLVSLFLSCNERSKNTDETSNAISTLFTKLDAEHTGINFINEIENEKDFNIFLYRNFYNGGGVAIGDINNDGLPDIYLTANRKKNKLYLNNGNFKFEDITDKAGVAGNKAWSTGVVLVDINADGLLDIYVCNAGYIKGDDQKNELFINNGDLTFTEKAEDYNLADSGFTTHAAFFDYDKDGDLDVYMLNNSFIPVGSLGYENKRNLRAKDWNVVDYVKGGGDKLFQNDNGIFKDVSDEANIFGSLIGFGLGVTVGDINNDLYPDIYVSNDFFEHDYLYINNQDGTFTESIKDWASHLSLFSMGADMADINNDGKSDIFITDMLPEGDERLKNTTNFETYDIYQLKLRNDFYHQYMQNTLQLNTGNAFSEIANYGGVSSTDWSWGALLFDMDNDGYRDIYVCNGIYHDLTNQDFIDFFEDVTRQQTAVYGDKEQKEAVINAMPSVAIPNYAFKNNQDLTFSNATSDWGFDTPSFSNGAAYGDLDNDGDLDLIINNVNQELFVYKNNSESRGHNYLRLKLEGEAPNTYGVGSVVEIFIKDKVIRQELIPSRGFQSSVDYTMTIGLGKIKNIDSLRVIWSNDKTEALRDISANTTLTMKQENAQDTYVLKNKEVPALLKEIDNTIVSHKENVHVDFDYEGLISKMLSQEGPAMAVADINNDGNEDIFIGGAKGQQAKIYFHLGDGRLKAAGTQDVFREDRLFEDTASAFFDADGDGDMDLIVGSGGNEPNSTSHSNYTNRLYINDGNGNFSKSPYIVKSVEHNVSAIAPYDFDQDGDVDLMIASRSVPGIYGIDPEHLLLENDGTGNFSDVTENKAYNLKDLGMVTAASWADVDGDSKKDLVLAGDWSTPLIFKNNGRRLRPLKTNLDSISGWWNTVHAEDIDGDGDIDLILGNQGNNTTYKVSEEAPSKIFINDFDNNGTIEQIVTRTVNGRDVPIALKRELTAQLVSLKKQNLKFSDYATKSINELLAPDILQNSIIKMVNTSESIIAINNGDGNFEIKKLPREAQFSCICGIHCTDIDKDGVMDIIFGGNNFEFKPQYSRLDASYGGILLGTTNGEFKWQPYDTSGFFTKGEIKHLLPFKDKSGREFLIVGRNNDTPKIFKFNN